MLHAPDSNVVCFIQRKFSVGHIKVNLKYDTAYLCPFIDHKTWLKMDIFDYLITLMAAALKPNWNKTCVQSLRPRIKAE